MLHLTHSPKLGQFVASAGVLLILGLLFLVDSGQRMAAAPAPDAGPGADGLGARSGALKEKLLKADGGTQESEAAVAEGLAWLVKHQARDGR
jgi:hypothetical protein